MKTYNASMVMGQPSVLDNINDPRKTIIRNYLERFIFDRLALTIINIRNNESKGENGAG